MHTITLNDHHYRLLRAAADDIPELVALLADDPLGATRESESIEPYLRAFADIDADPNQLLLAVRDEDDVLAATMQLTVIPCLARGGAKRLQIEAVRVAGYARGSGLGGALFEWAHAYGIGTGATLAQLTTDKSRVDAHRFYRNLGYQASHEGFKRDLAAE